MPHYDHYNRYEVEALVRGLMLGGLTYEQLLHALTEICHRDTESARAALQTDHWERLQTLCSLLTRAEYHARKAGL